MAGWTDGLGQRDQRGTKTAADVQHALACGDGQLLDQAGGDRSELGDAHSVVRACRPVEDAGDTGG